VFTEVLKSAAAKLSAGKSAVTSSAFSAKALKMLVACCLLLVACCLLLVAQTYDRSVV
jgi:hypothetical protein